MTCTKKNLLRHLRDVLIVTVIGMVVSLLFIIDNLTWKNLVIDVIYCAVLGSAIWKVNEWSSHWIEGIFPWHKSPGKTITWLIAGTVIFSIGTILLVNYIFYALIWKVDFWWFITQRNGTWLIVVQLMVTFIITLTIYLMSFFKSWRESVKNEEKFKRESLAFQYEALKNQVNPHFLFNSLNVLSSLVMKDQEGSVQFIRQLSEVYRYVLEQKDKDVVDLGTEMNFVESYLYLQKIRYAENLRIELSPELPGYYSRQVIPLSVQMLLENAIKHNVISGDEPLTIRIGVEGDYLVVSNNLQVRNTVPDSGNVGLSNIKSRYNYLTDKEFWFVNNGKEFVVWLPLVRYTTSS
jgi:sensor histidine kinase YesM